MSVPTGLWISCNLALLSVALGASLQNVDSTEPSARHCTEIPSGQFMFGGAGIKANYRPYYLTTPGPDRTPLELYSSSGDHCTVNLPGSRMHLYRVFQASPKIMYLFEYSLRMKIFSVDMSTCTTHDLRDKFHESHGVPTSAAIIYEDGFDEIFEEKNTTYFQSYDFAGNQIGQPRTFLHHAPMYYILPTSPKSRISNLIVGNFELVKPKAEDMKAYLDLVDADGRLIKHLLTFEYDPTLGLPVVNDIGDSAYTYCYRGKSDFECVQFDQSGNEVLRNSISYDGQKSGDNVSFALLSVRNLKDGPGFVLFTATYELTTDPLPAEVAEAATFRSPTIVKVTAAEIRPGKTIEKSYRLANKQYNPVTVTDYAEVSGRFIVQEGLHQTKEICSNTFSLATKHE